MTNKTYTLKDGTVLEVGKTVYEATPEGYLRMVAHHVEMFGMREEAPELWVDFHVANSSTGGRHKANKSYIYPQFFTDYAPFTIIWLPEQADDNVIPPDEVLHRWANDGETLHFKDPYSGIWVETNDRPNLISVMFIEVVIAKGVTFYKQKPEGV